MCMKSNQIISESEVSQSFIQEIRVSDNSPIIDMTDDEKIDFVAQRILKKYKAAFEELAK